MILRLRKSDLLIRHHFGQKRSRSRNKSRFVDPLKRMTHTHSDRSESFLDKQRDGRAEKLIWRPASKKHPLDP
ncbi:hypothetical protein CEXT_238891 [Caerostris extrusa]|uniref:Uncharacterized protein n=1 Tax=Caerostris extrusa TaxID=172846 RepID=A0AAV4RBC9_CAEEX|nr:hypothetical protein CEXT_238891 [Caerostris extrusa]